jgi:outer membrane protein assembly factor BamB
MKIKSAILIIIITMLFFLLSCSQNSDWLQFRGKDGNGISSSKISPPLAIRWKIQLQDTEQFESQRITSPNGKVSSLNPPIVIDNTIYFGSGDGNFYALDAESGYMRWVFKSGASINSIPCADEDNVYFGSQDGKLYALSRNTGEMVWSFQTESQINSQVARYGDYIIFAGDADAIYFLSPDGEEQFRIDNPGWYNFTFNISDDVMYFGTGMTTDVVGPYDINQKDFLWYLPFYEFDANLYSVTALNKNLLFFGTMNVYGGNSFSFHALDRETGNVIWQQERDFIFNQYSDEEIAEVLFRNTEMLDFLAPTIWKNSVIFTAGDCAARSFDLDSGFLRWEKSFDTPIASAPTIAAGRVYFGLLGDELNPPKLICISAQDGKLLWEMETEGALLSAPVIAGKRIIFGTDESVFYVLEEVF